MGWCRSRSIHRVYTQSRHAMAHCACNSSCCFTQANAVTSATTSPCCSPEVQTLQEDLIACKLREAEANMAIKQLQNQLFEVEKQWQVGHRFDFALCPHCMPVTFRNLGVKLNMEIDCLDSDTERGFDRAAKTSRTVIDCKC